MKQGTIKYSQEFISPTGLKRWVGIEMPVDFDTEDYLQVYEKVASMVVICGAKIPADLTEIVTQNAPPIIAEKAPSEETVRASTILEIYACKSIQMLETYKFQVNTHPDIKAAYQQQLSRLKGQQINLP